MHRQIEGYATRSSAPPGVPVDLAVSTTSRTYRVSAYRFGAYRDGDPALVWRSTVQPGWQQREPCFLARDTRTVIAPWRTTVSTGTTGWRPGFYVFRLTTDDGWHAYVPYVLRSASVVGKVVLAAPIATWQAYNDWGGYSLYHGPFPHHRAWAVSFDRPYKPPGASDILFGVEPLAVQAERAHVPLAYLADTDLDTHPGILRGAHAYVSLGHDEYWSARMRRAVTNARDAGTNLAIFGANTMYWKIRVTDTGHRLHQMIVGYRTDAATDPALRTDPGEATGRTRDMPGGAENALTGMDYECFPVDAPYQVTSPRWWGYRGTGLKGGTVFPHLVGVEADRVYPVATTPRPLQIVANTSYDCDGARTTAQAVYYTTPSGAGVFNAGTLRWSCAVAGHCHPYHLAARTIRFTRRVTLNVLRAFAIGPAGASHPATDNLNQFDLPASNRVPAS